MPVFRAPWAFSPWTHATLYPLSRTGLAVFLVAAGLLTAALLTPQEAWAGQGGVEFNEVYQKLVEWMKGTPGRIVMIMSVIVAVIVGITTQSIVGVAVSLGIGMVVYYGNSFVEGLITATLPLPSLPSLTPLAMTPLVGS